MWQSNDSDSSSYNSNHESEEKQIVSSSQEDESSEERILPFQRYYIKDYMSDKEGRLREDKNHRVININFNFQESFKIPDINISETLNLHNLEQFQSILHHYYDQSYVFNSITNHLEDEDLRKKIEKYKSYQANIDKKIDELSKYLKFIFKIFYHSLWSYTITYVNLNRFTLSLAIKHFESILLVFKNWNYLDSNGNEMDNLMTEVSKRYKEIVLYRPFQIYYIDGLPYSQSESPLIMLKINLEIIINLFPIDYHSDNDNDSNDIYNYSKVTYSLNRIFSINNVSHFKAILNFNNPLRDYLLPKTSSRYKDLYIDITYRNALQLHINKILYVLEMSNIYFKFEVEEDKYDPLTLNLHYCSQIQLLFFIRHLELIFQTFKIWNDNQNDRDASDLYILAVKNKFLSIIKDKLFESSWIDYIDYLSKYHEDSTTNNLQLNLHIILRQHQYTITKTLQLQKPIKFIRLLDYHNLLPNGYLPSSKSFDASLSNLLYIFNRDGDQDFYVSDKDKDEEPYKDSQDKNQDQDQDEELDEDLEGDFEEDFSEEQEEEEQEEEEQEDKSDEDFEENLDEDNSHILNFYYYPLSNELDTSLIIKHLKGMISSFKIFNQEVSNINISPTDIKTFSQYLSSITNELNSLSISPSPTQSFQHHFITQYQDRLAKPLPTTNLTIHLRLFLKDSHPISNTYPLQLSYTNQLISLLQHYSLRKDPLDPSWIEAYKEHTDLYKEITYRNRLQTSYDRVLSKLSKRVSFRVEEDPKDPSNLGIEYIDLTGSDVPYAVKHLDIMMMVYKAWNTSYKDKLEVDNLLFLMREDVEEWSSSDKSIPSNIRSNIRDDNSLNNTDSLESKLNDMIASVNSLSFRLGIKDTRDDEKREDGQRQSIPSSTIVVGSLPRDVHAIDGRLGGASTDIPNLMEVTGNDISMMEDVD